MDTAPPKNLREMVMAQNETLGHALGMLWDKCKTEYHSWQTPEGKAESGTPHCEAVETNCLRLIQHLGLHLTVHDLFLLSAAACLHDIDKGLPEPTKRQLAVALQYGTTASDLRHGIDQTEEAKGFNRHDGCPNHSAGIPRCPGALIDVFLPSLS